MPESSKVGWTGSMGMAVDSHRWLPADRDFPSRGSSVWVEPIAHFETAAGKIDLPAMAIFEVNEAGKITEWRDYFDRRQAGLE